MVDDGRWEALYKKWLGDVGGLPSSSDAKKALPATS
jgi:hypothetical protein